MTLDEIIERAGGKPEYLAEIIGVHRTTVIGYGHTRDRLIPPQHARKVAEALDIPLHEIRPDLWPDTSAASSNHALVTA